MGEWQSVLNARLYDEYARTHGMYQETSASLVGALSLHSVARAVDLACGSGVTTEALLRRVDGDGVIYGVDGSQAMLDVAMHRVQDERIRWCCADALDVGSVVGESCDVVVCNSAIWQLGGLTIFDRIHGALREGGEFVFNCWATPPRSEAPRPTATQGPNLVAAVRRIAAAEYGWVPPEPIPRKPDEFPLRDLVTDDLVGVVERAGFQVVERWWFVESSGSPDAAETWLRIPVMTEWYLPGVPYELRMTILERAAEELGLVGETSVEEPSRPAQAVPDGEPGSGIGWFCVRAVAR